jgi:hypothetical protein
MRASGYIKMHERIFFVTEAFFLRLNASPPYRMHVSPHLKQYCALPNVALVAGRYQTSIHLDSIPICCWLQFPNSQIADAGSFPNEKPHGSHGPTTDQGLGRMQGAMWQFSLY